MYGTTNDTLLETITDMSFGVTTHENSATELLAKAQRDKLHEYRAIIDPSLGPTGNTMYGTTNDTLLETVTDMSFGATTHENSAKELLAKAQRDKLHEYLPVIVYMGVISIIGIFGNVMTIKFYGSQRKRTSTVNLITALAVLDLIACGLIYTTIANLCVNITYTNVVLCKMMYFCDQFFIESSVLVLVVISIDRYRKVCKPFGKQLSIRASVFTVFAMIGLSFVITVRNFVTYDVVKVNVSVANQQNVTMVTGYYCTNTDDPDLHIYVVVFHAIDALSIAAVLTTLVYTYGHIWREMKKLKQKNLVGNSRRRRVRRNSFSSSRMPSFDSGLNDPLPDHKRTVKIGERLPITSVRFKVQHQMNAISNPNLLQVLGSKEQPMTTSVSNPNLLQVPGKNSPAMLAGEESSTSFNTASGISIEGKHKRNRKAKLLKALTSRTENNITVMMLAVSVGFVFCFAPYFFVSVGIRIFTTTGEFELHAGVQFALRSVFWNSVINPIIFCVFNPQYRRYIGKTLCRHGDLAADESVSSKFSTTHDI